MTKRELFKKAHEIARTFTGDYRARFALALKLIREGAGKMEEKLEQPESVSRIRVWEKYGKKRVYFTAVARGTDTKDYYFDCSDRKIYPVKAFGYNRVSNEAEAYFEANY